MLHPPIQRFLQRWQSGRSGCVPWRTMDPMKDLLRLTADYAAAFLAHAGRAAGRRDGVGRGAASARSVARCPRTGCEAAQVVAELIAAAEPGIVGTPDRPVLRLRDRQRAALGARRRLAGVGMGSERLLRRHLAGGGRRGGSRAAAWLAELLGLPEGVSSGFVTGAQGATRPLSRLRASTCSPGRGWDVARDGLHGAPRIRVLAGARAARHDRPVAPPTRARRPLGRARPGRRPGQDAGGCAPRRARECRRPDDRVRSGRQREHAARPTRWRRSLTACEDAAAPGCTSTARSGCGRPPALASGISSPGRSVRTPGRPTRTSG